MARKVLIATSCRWFSAARLAMAFNRAGCIVEAVCPAGHPALSTRTLQARYPFRELTPLRSLRVAILSSKPDIIIPTDDLVMTQLHRLYNLSAMSAKDESKTVCEVIRFSLGDPSGYATTESQK